MATSPPMPYEDRESSTTRWVTFFVLLSLLLHALVLLAVILISRFVPPAKLPAPPIEKPAVTLSLIAPPPPVQSRPPQPSMFMATEPDAGAKPNQKTPIQSDNDTRLRSQSQKPRLPDSVMPDVAGQKNRPMNLQETPLVQSTPKPAPATTPPAPMEDQQPKQPPTPPLPKPDQTQPKPAPPNPAKPAPKPADEKTPKPPPPKPEKTEDNPNGLPVLPPLNVATLAPQTPVNPTQQTRAAATPPPSFEARKSDISGAAGDQGPNSAATNATELGRYKAKVYRAVGARWYKKEADQRDLMPIGSVHIQFTIYADGTVTTNVLDGGNSTLQMLLAISVNSIREAAPYDPFTDSMRKELIKEQGGDGGSYTDDFTFGIY